MKRVFRLDMLKCARCGSERRWIAAHNSTAEASGEAIAKILACTNQCLSLAIRSPVSLELQAK